MKGVLARGTAGFLQGWERRAKIDSRLVLTDPGHALVAHQEFGFLQQQDHAR
jgi:hypothetical protein